MTTILMIVPVIIIATGPYLAFVQGAKKESGMMNNIIDSSGISQIIPSITEWIGIGVLTNTTRVSLLFRNNIILTKNANNRNGHRITETKVSLVDKRSTSLLEYKQKTKLVAINKNLLTRYKNLLDVNMDYY